MVQNEELNELIEQLKDRTLMYADELGITLDNNGFVSCLVPGHKDSNPSMHWWGELKAFYCFGCSEIVNIFRLAHIYENKPLTGRGFIDDNVFYLAEKFGIPYEHLKREMTPEEYEKQNKFRVMSVFSDYVVSHVNEEYLNSRHITKETANKLLIGSIKNYGAMINNLLSSGCSAEDLSEIGIDEFRVNPDKLIIIIKDEYGRPCSFTARDMKWSKEKGGPKYNNGKATSIFNKSRIFYGWSDIKKEFNSYEPLLIAEGYIDFITSYQKGYRNIIALGSASFTDDHISIIEKDRKIKTAAIALDHDTTGIKRTHSILERLKNIKTSKKYKFAVYKSDECKDLDEIINSYEEKIPLEEIFDFKTMFEYEILRLTETTETIDEGIVFDTFTAIISKTERPKEREDQIRTLCKYLNNYSQKTVTEEIDYLINSEKANVMKETDKIIDLARAAIKKDPDSSVLILERTIEEVKEIKQSTSRTVVDIFTRARNNFRSFEEDKTNSDKYLINFQIPFFDALNIYPGHTIIMSGLANRGKSSIYQHILINSLKYNENAFVLYISTDDSAEKVYSNMIAGMTGLDRGFCENPLYNEYYGLQSKNVLGSPSIKAKALAMHKIYTECCERVDEMLENKQLMILDVKDNVDNWNQLERTIKEIDADETVNKKYKILFIDSANKISVDGVSNENDVASFVSANLKKVTERHKFLTIANFELNKARPNERLRSDKLSGSRRMFYDCNVLAYIYQPMKDLASNGTSDLTWTFYNQNGVPTTMPILVSYMEKTKCGGNHLSDVPLFYELNTFNNVINAIDPETDKARQYTTIWQDEFSNKYISN